MVLPIYHKPPLRPVMNFTLRAACSATKALTRRKTDLLAEPVGLEGVYYQGKQLVVNLGFEGAVASAEGCIGAFVFAVVTLLTAIPQGNWQEE